MYRALALKALRAGVGLGDGEGLASLLRDTRISWWTAGWAVLDREDATAAIRTREVSAAASRISTHTPVRREMVARQQEMGREGGVVLDGRDIGTAVFPDADVKLYVDADPRRRAMRRRQELQDAGVDSDLEAIEAEIRERDHLDSTRRDSPLTRAPGAVHLDTTTLTPEEVLARMLEALKARE
jgi:cytidylate kinase